ncbi:MAG: hypothetical protein K5886_07335 [Lachnospiraceae bacterium]|nr:hypothetical protein [Lachnospiraceae bacterium]
MVRPVAIVSGESNRYRQGCMECMKQVGMTFALCGYEVADIASVASFVNTYIILLPSGFDIQFQQICHYLRDLCLEEEKNLYLYGNEEMVRTVRKIIPKLFISGVYYNTMVPIGDFVNSLKEELLVVSQSQSKPTMVMIDDDKIYFKQLSSMLQNSFNVTVTTPCLEDVVRYLNNADILLMNVKMKLPLMDVGILLDTIERRVKSDKLKLMYFTDTKEEQKYLNSIQLIPLICFSKEIPMEKIAYYLKKRYADYNIWVT